MFVINFSSSQSSPLEEYEESYDDGVGPLVDFDFKNFSKSVVRQSGNIIDVVVYYDKHSEYPDVVNTSDFYPACCNLSEHFDYTQGFFSRFGDDAERLLNTSEWMRVILFRFDNGTYMTHYLLLETAYELPILTVFENNDRGGVLILVMANDSPDATVPIIRPYSYFGHFFDRLGDWASEIVYVYNNHSIDAGMPTSDLLLNKIYEPAFIIISSSEHSLYEKGKNRYVASPVKRYNLVSLIANDDYTFSLNIDQSRDMILFYEETVIDNYYFNSNGCSGFLINITSFSAECNDRGLWGHSFDLWPHSCMNFTENAEEMFCHSVSDTWPEIYVDPSNSAIAHHNFSVDPSYKNHSSRIGFYNYTTEEFTSLGRELGVFYQFKLIGDLILIETGGDHREYNLEGTKLATFKQVEGDWTRTDYINMSTERLVGWAITPSGDLAVHVRDVNNPANSTLRLIDLGSGDIIEREIFDVELVMIEGVLLRGTKWNDGIGNSLKTYILTPKDTDNDGFPDKIDPCPIDYNEDTQLADLDNDGIPDLCDYDDDNDGVGDADDNCKRDSEPWDSNNETDFDGDGCIDNTADNDDDGDGINDDYDACPKSLIIVGSSVIDLDEDGCFDNEDMDWDGDGFNNVDDNCPRNLDLSFNPPAADYDNDGCSDSSDFDVDGDGVDDEYDSCQYSPIPNNSSNILNRTDVGGYIDLDGDGCFDLEDSDIDGDGITNEDDDCINEPINDVENITSNGCPINVAGNEQEDSEGEGQITDFSTKTPKTYFNVFLLILSLILFISTQLVRESAFEAKEWQENNTQYHFAQESLIEPNEREKCNSAHPSQLNTFEQDGLEYS